MCAGDLTVEPVLYDENTKIEMPEWPSQHTCRNFEEIRDWAFSRDAANASRKSKNAERLKRLGH